MELKNAVKNCNECRHSFKACECKFCSKCGTPFMKYFGTSIVKGRSHCRSCLSAACIACIMILDDHEKVCTRCHIKQCETEIKTEKALLAICEEKFGEVQSNLSVINGLKTYKQKVDAIFDAVKRGQDCLVITLINLGCDVNTEKGVDVNAVNDKGWSALHSAVSKAETDKHVESIEFLLEMGADVLLENHENETASDLAKRCAVNKKVIQILVAAEIEAAALELDSKIKFIERNNPSPKEKRLFRLITTIVNYLKDQHSNKIEVKHKMSRCEVRKSVSETNLQSCVSPEATNELVRNNTFSSSKLITQRSKSFLQILNEKSEWETRTRNLMQTIAFSNTEHQKEIALLKNEIHIINEENAKNSAKVELLFAEKMSKLKQDKLMLESQLANSYEAYKDLCHLQKSLKLTWIPDNIVKFCQNAKCKLPFSKALRKHHCRCCGRVFCAECTKNKMSLKSLGYPNLVRVCISCFELVDGITGQVDEIFGRIDLN
ncbi:RUN and FYVE domain-containing protein 2-like isoform X4 [Hydra vulgaris]|uniref:RUN and FYVE domain-containing protein 2-like isoform X4 n=1 Tax=Hydra vulgaris TaxID=6087 RepID=A0ABM4BVI2_HYDVU